MLGTFENYITEVAKFDVSDKIIKNSYKDLTPKHISCKQFKSMGAILHSVLLKFLKL
jgi:hypothetical protein